MSRDEPIFETHAVGPLRCNAYILGCPRTRKGIIVDPGGDADLLLERVRALGLEIDALVHTHTHFDHIDASGRLAEELGSPVLIHSADLGLYRILPRQRMLFGFAPGPAPREPDSFIEDEEEIRIGDLSLQVIHTPGHTLGSVCLKMGGRLFSGDTLFQGSVGRTDVGGTSLEELVRSIRERLFPLDGGTAVLPGHGEPTVLDVEKRTNPFLS